MGYQQVTERGRENSNKEARSSKQIRNSKAKRAARSLTGQVFIFIFGEKDSGGV
jgi:hypothetical protein